MFSLVASYARRASVRLTLLVALLTALALANAATPSTAGASSVAIAPPEAEQAMIGLINLERSAAGLPGLSLGSGHRDVAVRRAEEMAATDYLSHYNHDGIGAEWLLDERGVARSMTGENIGRTLDPSGYSAMDVVGMLHDAFMRSEKHRENVLDGRFHQVGVGMASANGKYYIAVVFTD